MAAAALIGAAAVQAGNLEPGAPPGPTMKTLDEIPPTWSQMLSVSTRYVVVMGGIGVLDKETGLVWERSPHLPLSGPMNWNRAHLNCSAGSPYGRAGWRLPTLEELTSVTAANRALPAGHPFDVDCSDDRCLGGGLFWSGTTYLDDPSAAFVFDPVIGGHTVAPKTSNQNTWCVRGGHYADHGR